MAVTPVVAVVVDRPLLICNAVGGSLLVAVVAVAAAQPGDLAAHAVAVAAVVEASG